MRRTYRPSIALAAGLIAAAAPAVGWAQDGSGKSGTDVDDVFMSVIEDPDGSEGKIANEISPPPRAAGRSAPGGTDDSAGNSNAGGETRGIERALEVGPERSERATQVLEPLRDRVPVPDEVRGIGRDPGNAGGGGGKPDETPGNGPN